MMLVAACLFVLFAYQMPAMSQQTPHHFCQGHKLRRAFLSARNSLSALGLDRRTQSESCYIKSITSTAQHGVMQTQS